MKAVKTKKGKVKRIMLIILLVFIGIIISLVLFRAVYRETLRSKNAIKTQNGIDLMETVEIGGIQQVLYFRGRDIDNPVILYLHGGPASSEMQLLHGFQYEWEDTFTVVHLNEWYRTLGKSHSIFKKN